MFFSARELRAREFEKITQMRGLTKRGLRIDRTRRKGKRLRDSHVREEEIKRVG
jgi:hypothetical protein